MHMHMRKYDVEGYLLLCAWRNEDPQLPGEKEKPKLIQTKARKEIKCMAMAIAIAIFKARRRKKEKRLKRTNLPLHHPPLPHPPHPI